MIYLENKIGVPQDVMIVKEVATKKTNKAVNEQQAKEIAQEEAKAAVDAQQFKTINGEDIRGEGNIEIQGGGDVTSVNGQKGDVVIDIPKKTSQLQNDSKFITNANTIGGVRKIWQGSQSEYDAIENKDRGTLYIIL